MEVIEGPVQLLTCCPGDGEQAVSRCRIEDSCLIKLNVGRVHERLMEFLHDVTLDQIVPETATATHTVTTVRSQTLSP